MLGGGGRRPAAASSRKGRRRRRRGSIRSSSSEEDDDDYDYGYEYDEKMGGFNNNNNTNNNDDVENPIIASSALGSISETTTLPKRTLSTTTKSVRFGGTFLKNSRRPSLYSGDADDGDTIRSSPPSATTTSPPSNRHSAAVHRHNGQVASDAEENPFLHLIIYPWTRMYKLWFFFTVFWSMLTIFFESYQLAFGTAGLAPYHDAASIFEYLFTAVFLADMIINFNLAYYDHKNRIVTSRKRIANKYLHNMLWVDVVGVFPFYAVALACSGQLGQDTKLTQYLAILRLFRLVRLHRVKQLFDALQYNTKVSLMSLTLIRNFGAVMTWTHFSACIMYFIARQYDFDVDNTWLGASLVGLSGFERYLTSLYWSIVTFTTVGYGDFAPVNAAEQLWDMVFMLLNMIMMAWIIGSMTLLIVKSDADTSEYRDMLKKLDRYSETHYFDSRFHKRLKAQLKLEYNNREIADEQILQHFPGSVRRRVLRKLYRPFIMRTTLMNGIRQQFVDDFLTTCHVEIYSPGEEIVTRGTISMDLYLLIEGRAKCVPYDASMEVDDSTTHRDDSTNRGGGGGGFGTSFFSDSENTNTNRQSQQLDENGVYLHRRVGPGEFINEIGFFTETPQANTVRTVSVCKTLTISRSDYHTLAEAHPGCSNKILQNLLDRVERNAREMGIKSPTLSLTQSLSHLKAGSDFDDPAEDNDQNDDDYMQDIDAMAQTQADLASLRDLISIHIQKQKDGHTTTFLFAGSRGDIPTISLMCDQNFDPNSTDYDSRTALMVAAMKGHSKAVAKLLEYKANPNLVDVHGTTALLEATTHGHDKTVEVLLEHGAELGIDERRAAFLLGQAIFDGSVLSLRRLLKAGIQVDAGDLDNRRAVHFAAAQGNLAALKMLVEYGADLTVKDRWNNTVEEEARKANASQLLSYMRELESST